MHLWRALSFDIARWSILKTTKHTCKPVLLSTPIPNKTVGLRLSKGIIERLSVTGHVLTLEASTHVKKRGNNAF